MQARRPLEILKKERRLAVVTDGKSVFKGIKRLVICPDSFKGSISSSDAGHAIEKGILARLPDAVTACVPIADGGEGTLDALVPAENRIGLSVCDPLGRRIYAEYGYITDALGVRTAVIECASAAGLTLLSESERDPRLTSTYGVGEMIKNALERGFEHILLTVGGSATNDCGCGMAAALGVRFFDADGRSFVPVGGTLSDIDGIDISGLDQRLGKAGVLIACDVKNPLTGEHGASTVYAPQKGADEAAVAELECGVVHCAAIISKMCGKDISVIPGSGAAGGIGVPLTAFCRARIVSGIDAVLDAVGFDALMAECDAVITGEGRLDLQSLCGKAVSGIARRALAHGVPTYVICGSVGDGLCSGCELVKHAGIKEIISLSDSDENLTLEYSMVYAAEFIERAAERLAARIVVVL